MKRSPRANREIDSTENLHPHQPLSPLVRPLRAGKGIIFFILRVREPFTPVPFFHFSWARCTPQKGLMMLPSGLDACGWIRCSASFVPVLGILLQYFAYLFSLMKDMSITRQNLFPLSFLRRHIDCYKSCFVSLPVQYYSLFYGGGIGSPLSLRKNFSSSWGDIPGDSRSATLPWPSLSFR